MKLYEVTITELLKMKVDIDANSKEEAEEIARKAWKRNSYVLCADDFDHVEFDAKDVK